MTSLDGKNQFSMVRLCLPKPGNSKPSISIMLTPCTLFRDLFALFLSMLPTYPQQEGIKTIDVTFTLLDNYILEFVLDATFMYRSASSNCQLTFSFAKSLFKLPYVT